MSGNRLCSGAMPKSIRAAQAIREEHHEHVAQLYIVKDRILEFVQEPRGEFMAVIPVGHPVRPSSGPNKKPLANVVKRL